ncbi:hypothetical protein Q3G72_026735 [Acer saccharum]|nr:hypothetical protein Q3G72_026735 [Acer saccharum]
MGFMFFAQQLLNNDTKFESSNGLDTMVNMDTEKGLDTSSSAKRARAEHGFQTRRAVRGGGAAVVATATAAAMVLKTELCRFSGAKIYPGRGIRFIRSDSQVFLFANSKCKRYFHNRLKPSKLTWTAMYRKQHKKDIAQEAVKKRRRAAKKPYSRSIVGATLEVIQKRRAEKPEVRDAAREAALREIKERIKKTKDEKKAKKAEVTAKSQKTGKGNVPKGAAPKGGPKLGGGGGKR